MPCGAGAERPAEQPIGLADRHVIDACFTTAHQALGVELPLLVTMRAIPVPGIVVPFVLKPHGDAIVRDGPEFLYQTVIELPGPFAPQELDDCRPTLKKFGPIAPPAIFGMGERDSPGWRVFQASSAIRPFCAAVSTVNGGWGGRIMNSPS